MCTVSWWLENEDLHIIVNRDEKKARTTATWPACFSENNIAAIMPIDPEGNGSWITANENGWSFCLLNDYMSSYVPSAHIQQSRGQLIKSLAHCANWQQLDQVMQESEMQRYAPFKLLLFIGRQEPLLWHWNGYELRKFLAAKSPISSSSKWPNLIPKLRQWYWRRQMASSPSLHTQLQLHKCGNPINSYGAIAMRRRHTETVSITKLKVTSNNILMEYWAGHPCKHSVMADCSLAIPIPALAKHDISFTTSLDIANILRRYTPKLAIGLNNWQLTLLRWCLAEKKVNRVLKSVNEQPAERFCDASLQHLGVLPEVIGNCWPSVEQRPVFICNHPTGGIDGLLLISVLQKRYPNVLVIANEVLCEVQQIGPSIVAVPVFAKPKDALPAIQAAFASSAPILIFPAGRTARLQDNTLDDGPWAKLTVTLALREQRSLTVLHLNTQNSLRFYALAWMRNKLRINANLEMLLLVREMLKPAISNPRLYVGATLPASELSNLANSDLQRITVLKESSYQLPDIYKDKLNVELQPNCSRRISGKNCR